MTDTRADVIHLSDPEHGPSYCGEPVTLINAAGDNRPVCQACHRGAMRRVRAAQAIHTRPDREAIRDELSGWPIGGGYYQTQVQVSEAAEMADAILALLSDQPTSADVLDQAADDLASTPDSDPANLWMFNDMAAWLRARAARMRGEQ